MKAEKANQELSVEMYFVGIRLPVLTCTYLTRLIHLSAVAAALLSLQCM